MDEPLADAASVALYFVNREASKQVKVCLSGEGADEFFGGYNIYKEPFTVTWYDKIPLPIRRAIGAVIVGGISLAFLLTLFLTPVIYVLIESIRAGHAEKETRKVPAE